MRERRTVWERQELNERERGTVSERRELRGKKINYSKKEEKGQSLCWRDRNGVHGRNMTCNRVTGTIWKVQYLWGRDRNYVGGTGTVWEGQELCGRDSSFIEGNSTEGKR